MTTIDDRIGAALSDDDREFLASLDHDRGMFTQIGDVLAGPLGGWAKLILFVSVFVGIGVVYSGFRFFTAAESADLIRWGFVTLALLIMQGFVKEWFYDRMNMLSVLREIKRLQVQVAMQAEQQG